MASSEASETKCIITGLLTSNPVRCTIKQLCNDFINFVGYKIPIRQMGFNNVEDYLRSIPDTVVVYGSGPTAEVQGIIKPKSAHINEMVVKQKKTSIPKHKRAHVRSYPRYGNSGPRQPIRPLLSYVATPPPNFNAYRYSASTSSVSPVSSINTSFESYTSDTRFSPLPVERMEPPPTRIESQPAPVESPPIPIETPPTPVEVQPTPIEAPLTPAESVVNNTSRRLVDYDSSSSVDLDEYGSNVPARIQNNLRKLILQFPDGIWCTKLPVEYNKMFKKKLSYENYGYRSLIEMCSDLSEIFHYIQPTSDDFILYDKNKPIPPLDQNDTATNHQQAGENVATRNIMNETQKLPWEVGPFLIPSDVLHLGDRIARYAINSDKQMGEYLDVCIGEIYDLSKFWVYLTFGDLKKLMSDLQSFFRNQRNKYLIPELLLEEGLYCTCLYAGEFHRAVIVNLLPKLAGFVRVLFIDYGTVGNVQSSEIWYLPKQFGTVPCQAIRARLSNIYPPYENRPWSIQAVNRFRELITKTALVAEVTSIDKDDNILEIYLADITDENHIFYINDVLVKEGLALYTGQERKQTLIDPNCIPNVEYIHLYPEFYEIEGGYAPTTPEMNYILKNKLPMHFYMPQYFDIYFHEDIDYIEKQHEKFIKVVPNFKRKPVIVKQDFDFSFFPDDLVEEIRDLVRQEEAMQTAKPKKPCSDQNKVVPKVESRGDGEKRTTESVKEYFCNKKRISELINGGMKAESDLQLDTRQYSRSSSVVSSSLDVSQEDFVPLNNSLNNLSLNNSGRSVLNVSTKSFNSTNPFFSEDHVSANPFRTSANSTNPFLNNLEETINTSDLFEIFSKSSEEKLPDKIVNNLNQPSFTPKLNKQVNVERSNASDTLTSSNALNNNSMTLKSASVESSFKSPEKPEDPRLNEPRRVRTPPGFSSTNHQNPTWNPNYNEYNLNYNNFMASYPSNPYYQRFQPPPQFNNSYNFSMLQNNPTLMQNYYNFIPQIYPNVPGSFQFNLQCLQRALGGPNQQPRPPFNNYGPYYNNN